MQLPAPLRDAIDEIASEIPTNDLKRAANELSDAYRADDFAKAPLNSHARRVAYLVQRMPATFAACARVFAEVRALAPEFAPKSMLDLGAGPGTATFAAAQTWTSIERVTLVERDPALLATAAKLAAASEQHARHTAVNADVPAFLSQRESLNRTKTSDVKSASASEALGSFDLVVVSYAMGEFAKPKQQEVITGAWKRANFLIVVEPGTPRGFANVLKARDTLAGLGAHIVAPCPRADAHPCPMAVAGDWCHFAQRVERSSLHRQLKGGDLGYEDEKFSYVVFSRTPLPTAPARIVRHPDIRKGHVELQLCTPQGIERVTLGKSKKDLYRAARRAQWGDALEF